VKQNTRHIDTDLTIIGSGLAGVAASSFALRRNIRTAQAGNTGALAYTTGYFDLLGSLTGGSGASISDPWEGIRRLRESEPLHPLARIAKMISGRPLRNLSPFLPNAESPTENRATGIWTH
jgi:glycerol-3-phosphate dehydrogenase subunit B